MDLAAAHAAVKRTARHYRSSLRTLMPFARGEAVGPLVRLSVTDGLLDRALRFVDLLLRSAESLGWSLIEPEVEQTSSPSAPRYSSYGPPSPKPKPAPRYGDLLVDGERIPFLIEERLRKERRRPTPQEQARMKREYGYRPPLVTDHPTGVLRIVRLTGRGFFDHRKSWYDRSSALLEAQIPTVLAGFRELAQIKKARREECEREQRLREEQERQRRRLAERRAANQQLIQELERQAGAWHRARFLRAYLRAARRVLGDSTITVDLRGAPTDLLAWAEPYVEQLDPLGHAPHDADLVPERSYGPYVESERLQGELRRLSGYAWPEAAKLAGDENQ